MYDFICSLVPIFSSPDIELELQQATVDHFIPAFQLSDSNNGTNDFTVLGDNDGSTLSHHMKVCINVYMQRVSYG